MDYITVGIIFLAIFVVLFLILRHFNCWYWKQNEIVDLLNSINRKLNDMSYNSNSNNILSSSNSPNYEQFYSSGSSGDTKKCKKCGCENSSSATTCKDCGEYL